jgi:hypothetical protein
VRRKINPLIIPTLHPGRRRALNARPPGEGRVRENGASLTRTDQMKIINKIKYLGKFIETRS